MATEPQRSILIADDDPDVVEAMKMVLEASGFTVRSAPNGKECLRKLREELPDLLILDVMMTTETEGFHIAYEIRQDPDLRALPVLMLTAIEQKSGFKFSPDADGDFLPVEDFVTKPVEPEELLRRINTLIEKREAQG